MGLEQSLSEMDLGLGELPAERSYYVHPDEAFQLSDTYFQHGANKTIISEKDKIEKELV